MEVNAERSPQVEILSLAEWSVREEIYAATQRWYLIILFCLVGSFIGWAVMRAWPSPHRVTKELFVGLTVYQSGKTRSVSESVGLPILNANDYKNWQMASLNTIIYADPVLEETLARLQALDPYWNSVERDQLAGMLHAYWRNAGKWRLVAEHNNPMYATEAVILWQDVVIEQVHASVAAAQEALQLDMQMQATAGEVSQAADRANLMAETKERLAALRPRLQALPPDGMPGGLRMEVWQAAAPLFESSEGRLLEESFPAQAAPAEAYLEWIRQAVPVVNAELVEARSQYTAHSERYAELAQQYAQAAEASLGLSAELLVQKISDRRLDASEVRPTGEAMLIGAGLGLIVWFLGWLVRPAMQVARAAQTGQKGRPRA